MHDEHLAETTISVAETEQAEVVSYLNRPSITSRDIYRLCCLLESPDGPTVKAAGLVLKVALVKPMREGRLDYLRQYRPDLLRALQEAGLEQLDEGDSDARPA